MTLVNIARTALFKGVDLLATGDGLHAEWLDELGQHLEEAEPGWYALTPATQAEVTRGVPEFLHRPLRFVVSVEVSCAPPGTPRLGGLHHLIYFPSLESARTFRARMLRHGSLADGRPELALTPRELLAELRAQDAACQLAPAHVMNPWYSAFGTVSGARTLEELFGEDAPQLLAIETGLTSTPAMCRRLSCLDRLGLFSNSDAHSLENIGRECTLLDIEPGYRAFVAALRGGSAAGVTGTIKFPLERTRYFRNRCAACEESFDGARCPRCGRRLVMGSRDRLELIADRAEPVFPPKSPPFLQILPLAYVIADLLQVARDSKAVRGWQERLVTALGHERHVLTEATEERIATVTTTQLARAIVAQRTRPPGRVVKSAREKPPDEGQLGLFGIS